MAVVWFFLAFQWAIVVFCTLIIVVFFGVQAACSFFLGALSYALPTLLMVCFLSVFKSYRSSELFLVMAEGLKIILAVVLMLLVFIYYPALRFLPFLLGILLASQFVFLIFLKVYRYVK